MTPEIKKSKIRKADIREMVSDLESLYQRGKITKEWLFAFVSLIMGVEMEKKVEIKMRRFEQKLDRKLSRHDRLAAK